MPVLTHPEADPETVHGVGVLSAHSDPTMTRPSGLLQLVHVEDREIVMTIDSRLVEPELQHKIENGQEILWGELARALRATDWSGNNTRTRNP